jgi:hypothetical protein
MAKVEQSSRLRAWGLVPQAEQVQQAAVLSVESVRAL